MRRVVSLLLALLLAIGMILLAACDKSERSTGNNTQDVSKQQQAESNKEVELKVFHRWPPRNTLTGKIFKKFFDEFDAADNNISVVVETVPIAMYEAQLTVKMSSSEAPDIFCLWPGGRVEAQVRHGNLLDITDLWEQEGWLYEFTNSAVEGCKHIDGKYYTLPIDVNTNVFWYNKKIFEEVDVQPPQTWNDLLYVAEELKQAGYTPFVVGGNPTRWMPAFWFDYLILHTAGGEFRENLMWGKESWESAEVMRVFEIWKDMLDKGYFNSDFASIDDEQATFLMASGEAAMMLAGPVACSNLMNEKIGWIPEKDFDIFPFPNIDINIPQVNEGNIQAWCINARTNKIEQAKSLLAYLGAPEQARRYSKEIYKINPYKVVDFNIFPEETREILKKQMNLTNEYPLYQNFELSTLPVMQDAGMDGIIEFMTSPDKYKEICAKLEQVSKETFNE
jgi:ABC-type glycerol-3-phosphate transport system substrate-binding protein